LAKVELSRQRDWSTGALLWQMMNGLGVSPGRMKQGS